MVLLVLLVTIPFTVVLAIQNASLHREKVGNVYQQAMTLALNIAAHPKQILPDPRAYLTSVSRLPEMAHAEQCDALLAVFNPILKVSPYFLSFAVFRTDGERICPRLTSGVYVNVSDRDYFQRVVENKTYTISNFLTGRLTKKPSIIFAQPVLNEQAELKYVVNLALDTGWLATALKEATTKVILPPGSAVVIFDDAGRPLAATPSSVGDVAEWDRMRPLSWRMKNPAHEEVWPDGIRRATVYVPLFNSESGGVWIRTGVPLEPALKEIAEDNRRRVILVISVVAIALLLAWFTSERLVLKPIHRIWSAAMALRRGDFSARVLNVKDAGELGELAIAFNSMAERVDADRQHLHRLATQDALTGLANRNAIREHLDAAIRASLASRTLTGVILLDLNQFKEINNGLGHPVGDQVLIQIADALTSAAGERATVGRLGGDEFVLILEARENYHAFEELARLVATRLRQPVIVDGQQFFVSASMGIAVAPDHGVDVATLLQKADVAMYQAQANRTVGFCFYTASMNERASKRLQMQNLLSQAIIKNELALHFQPKYSAQTTRITGVEALVRWKSAELGLVPPGEFIELAEQTGLILEIGEWVLKAACAQLSAWREVAPRGFTMAVNLSPRQLSDPELVPKISALLTASGVPASQLEFEITEGALMHNPTEAIETLTRLRDRGAMVSVDDFGTGYSSLGYLTRLPIDALKIDKVFVAGLAAETCNRTIINAIIAIAKELSLRVTAEGVETESQLAILRSLGCDEIQGYLLSRPLPPTALIKLLQAEADKRGLEQ
jgi:diguanylate cyclase (GGDEF)-like protein